MISKIMDSYVMKLIMLSIYSIYAFQESGIMGVCFVWYIMGYLFNLDAKIKNNE